MNVQPNMKSSDRITAINTVHDLKKHRESLAREINQDGIWLFLAVLGCMGLPHSWLRLVALFLCVSFFFYRLWASVDDLRIEENAARRDAIERAKETSEEAKQLIDELEKEYSGFRLVITKAWPYFASFLFLGLCIAIALVEMEIKSKQQPQPTAMSATPPVALEPGRSNGPRPGR